MCYSDHTISIDGIEAAIKQLKLNKNDGTSNLVSDK